MEKLTVTPIIIIGVKGIARELGISTHVVRRNFLPRPDFPVRKGKDGGNSAWLSTRSALQEWADNLVKEKLTNKEMTS